MFVRLQANNVADNIIKAGDGAGDGHCSRNYFIGERVRLLVLRQLRPTSKV